MKEGYDAKPLGIRITMRDQEMLRYLAKKAYPGLHLNMSDISRMVMREGYKAFGVDYDEWEDGAAEHPAVVHQPFTVRKKR